MNYRALKYLLKKRIYSLLCSLSAINPASSPHLECCNSHSTGLSICTLASVSLLSPLQHKPQIPCPLKTRQGLSLLPEWRKSHLSSSVWSDPPPTFQPLHPALTYSFWATTTKAFSQPSVLSTIPPNPFCILFDVPGKLPHLHHILNR